MRRGGGARRGRDGGRDGGGGRGRRPRGHLQRAMARVVEATSTLANYLKETSAFGLMTATVVQRIAQMSVADHEEGGLPRSP